MTALRSDLLLRRGFIDGAGVHEHPEVIEGALAFPCGPGASFITGQTMVIDGGQYFH